MKKVGRIGVELLRRRGIEVGKIEMGECGGR